VPVPGRSDAASTRLGSRELCASGFGGRRRPAHASVAAAVDRVKAKFNGLLEPFAPELQQASILSHAWGIEKLTDLSPLLASMTLNSAQD
jgi:hypothetical protein